MSQAEELLKSLTSSETETDTETDTETEVVTEHTHSVIDPDGYFVINTETREIESSSLENVLMQYDHKSEIYTFEVPRYVEGHDMTLCNRVLVHFNNIGGTPEECHEDIAELDDLQINPENPETVICSWLIRREATQFAGILSILVQYMCVADDGTIDYEWHSDIYSDITVKAGRNNSEQAVIEYTNILEQWRSKIFGAGDSVMANIAEEGETQVELVTNTGETQVESVVTAGEAQKTAVELKGVETLATIPEDYTTTYNMAEEALRRKADAITLNKSGTVISINDASDGYLLGLNVYGKTEPDSFMSVEHPIVFICGKNLFNMGGIKDTDTITRLEDGTISVSHYYNPTQITLKELAPGLSAGLKCKLNIDTDGATFIYLTRYGRVWDNGGILELTDDMINSHVCIYGKYEQVDGSTIIRSIQITLSDLSNEYERYKDAQKFTVPHILRGVQTETDTIYTDSIGRKWACDEINYETREFTQRIKSSLVTFMAGGYLANGNYYAVMNTPDKAYRNAGVMCDSAPLYSKDIGYEVGYFYENPMNVVFIGTPDDTLETMAAKYESAIIQYVLAEPIVTTLTDEEITLFKQLHTNYYNTIVLNDSDAHMEIQYAADTEIYLRDNQPVPTEEQVTENIYNYLDENGVQVPTDDHINELIYAALGVIENASY